MDFEPEVDAETVVDAEIIKKPALFFEILARTDGLLWRDWRHPYETALHRL
jgi:hypothetical protein